MAVRNIIVLYLGHPVFGRGFKLLLFENLGKESGAPLS